MRLRRFIVSIVKIESQSFPHILEHPRFSLKCLVKIQSLSDSHEGGASGRKTVCLAELCGRTHVEHFQRRVISTICDSNFTIYCNELVFNRFALKGTEVPYPGTKAGFIELINFQRQIGG